MMPNGCVSLNRKTYDALRAWCVRHQVAMAYTVESLLADITGELPAPRRMRAKRHRGRFR